ncbi:hypothetical protein Sjap_019892 [Stephania japonica]|uniref:Uncharacterized protein n=1 Tax=Stephania japonica TaxID=461633 RepID=A0AAP0F711_9MAGN
MVVPLLVSMPGKTLRSFLCDGGSRQGGVQQRQGALPRGLPMRIERLDLKTLVISQWLPTTIIMIDSKAHTIMVEVCDFCGEYLHPTLSENQSSRDIIRYYLANVQDMNLTEQELNQWIEQRNQEVEEEIKSIVQKISAETISAIPLESVEVNEVTPVEDYWSEPEEIIKVSLHEPDIIIAQNEADEAEKEINVILERPEEPQKECKEDQPLVLVKPPTLLCLLVKFKKGVVKKERSQIFYTANTFVSDDYDLTDSYVLEVPDELLNLKEGMSVELSKAIDASFVVDISKVEGIT